MYTCTFTCPRCSEDFEHEWSFGDEVTCPKCATRYKTDWETNTDDDILGPWLDGEAPPPDKASETRQA